MAVIGSVTFDPAAPAVGESVKVDVCGPDGKPYGNSGEPYIAIDGVAGSSQHLQFAWPGEHQLVVTAAGPDGHAEHDVATVTVVPPVSENADLTLRLRGLGRPVDQADLERAASLAAKVLTIAQHPDRELAYGASFAVRPIAALITPPPRGRGGTRPEGARSVAGEACPAPGPATSQPIPFVAPTAATLAAAERYEWNFGDGSEPIRTVDPAADHDYEPHLGVDREYEQFDVSVRDLQQPNAPESVRTVSVLNAYVACKRRGYLVPRVLVRGGRSVRAPRSSAPPSSSTGRRRRSRCARGRSRPCSPTRRVVTGTRRPRR